MKKKNDNKVNKSNKVTTNNKNNKSNNKQKYTTRIIAIALCAITVFGIIAGAIAGGGGGSGTTNGLQSSLADVLKPKKRITEAQLAEVVNKNKNNDFSLETVVKTLGNPGAVMAEINGAAVNYAEDGDIKYMLENYSKFEGYSKDSIIQLMWMTEDEDLVFTYVATDYNTPTIVGMTKQTLKEVKAGAKHIPTTEHKLTDFNEYTTETLKNFENAFLSSIQYPLLKCYFTTNKVASSDPSAVWTTKVVQNKTGLIYILLKDGKPYQMYQDYTSKNVPTYDKSKDLWSGLNERQFLNVYPDALRIQLYNYTEAENEYFIISYVVNEKGSDGKIKEVIYNIVDEDLYVYDDKGELVTGNGGLIIENGNYKPTEKNETTESTTEPTTVPSNPLAPVN